MPKGKRLFLTERDLCILRSLYRCRYLRATQLVSLLRPKSEKRFIERLGDLYHEVGLIDRPAAQWRRFDARYQSIVYQLSPKGLHLLRERGELPRRAVTFSTGGRSNPAPQFDHAMMIVDALVGIEQETRKKRGQRFVPVDEILARMRTKGICNNCVKHPLAVSVTISTSRHLPFLTKPLTTHLIPDALYGIEQLIDGEKRYRFFALECENTSPKTRTTARHSSLALKQAAYEAFIGQRRYREAWGIPNLSLQLVGHSGEAEPSLQ